MELILIICVFVIVVLLIKIFLMKKTVREIGSEFANRVESDTNSLITVTSRDKDIKNLAEELNESLLQLHKAYRKYTQGDMEVKHAITNISHDIRTPLTAICGYITLSKRLEKSEELNNYLNIMEDRALYMKKLMEELFEYSIITSSEDEIKLEEISVNRILEDTLMKYYGALVQREITPVVEITEQSVIRKLNKAKTERIFSNLISNALKYSDGDLFVSLSDTGIITFSNSAKKLSPIIVERLFERFYTVETTRNSTGLGLTIVKKLVEQMGGAIIARYENGRIIIEICFEGK